MDMKMVDTEDQREDRKIMPALPGIPPKLERRAANKYPNRATRRKVAKRAGVFKHKGAWRYVNEGRPKNKSTRKRDEDTDII